MKHQLQWAIKPDVPEEVYTDRQTFIERFVTDAYEAIARRTMSIELLGILDALFSQCEKISVDGKKNS
jgi:hypothetical protein